MTRLKRLLNKIINAIFPPDITCINCNEELQKDEEREFCVCESCKEKLVYIGDKKQEIGNKELGFVTFITVFAYDSVARNLVIGFKDANKPYLGEYIAKFLICEYKKRENDSEIVAYVPSSKRKIAKRGYDPMRIVADFFAKGVALPKIDALIRKNKQTDQTESKDRYQNIKGQFNFVSGDIKGKKVLLLDDVVTTGATAAECSKLLLLAGAKSVTLVTFTEAKSFNEYKNKTIKRMEKHSMDSFVC